MDEWVSVPSCSLKQLDAINSKNNQDVTEIKLYTYDWILHNHHMIMPAPKAVRSPVFIVGLNGEAGLCMYLSPNNDSLLVEIGLAIKHVTPQREAIKRMSFNKAVLNLEFLDCDGNTLKFYMRLPCRPMYVNNRVGLYSWKKVENLSMFSDNAPLHIRLKLSLRYPTVPSSNKSSDSRSIELLSNDMKKLLNDKSHFPDMAVKVDDRIFHVHKAVALNQLTDIAALNSESNFTQVDSTLQSANSNIGLETIFISNENAEVFFSVLHYMYSGKIYVSDALDDFGLYDFTKKYKLHELSMALKPSEMHIQTQITQMKLSFTWYVKNYSSLCQGTFNTYRCPRFIIGDTMWNVTIFAFRPHTIFLTLHRISGFNRNIQTVFKLKVCNIDGTPHDEREFKHFFKSSTTASGHPNFLSTESQFSIGPNLLYHDKLLIGCDLIVSNGQMMSEEKLTHPGLCPNVGSAGWSSNLQSMLENKTFTDVSLLVDENEFRVHKAILSARSPVFERMFQSDMAEKFSGRVTIEDISSTAVKHTINYIYTGLIDNITMQCAPELYRTADKYELLDLKDRCMEYIVNNLDVEYACEVLILSYLYNDKKMKEVAENLICKRAAQTLLTSHGQALMTHYPHLVHGLLENLSAVFCSLPPQDAYLHNGSNI